MSDLDKLEGLLPKLVHFLPNVRLRSSSSLLFKLESGLLAHVLKFNASYVQMIIDAIVDSLKILTTESDDWKNVASVEAQTISTLCLCLVHISKHEPGDESNSTNYARLLEKLFSLQSYGILDGQAKTNLDAAIAGIGAIGSPTGTSHVDSSSFLRKAEEVSMVEKVIENNKGSLKGAGAILQTPLSSYGWQFPKVILTEMDEKFLFDVEVKVKMGHESASDLLWECITDFPAPTLVAHPGLIHAVLDSIGAANSVGAPASPKCLNAVGAMKWMEKLVMLAVRAYETQLDGRLCSMGVSVRSEDDVEGRGSAQPAKSLASNMTQTLQNMRYPSVTMEEEGSEFVTVYGEPIVRSSVAMNKITAKGVHPAPSLPGLAFSACAASLPLLQGSDPATIASVASLLKVALPYVKEPLPFDSGVGQADSDATAKEVDTLRLQHLMNRMERILSTQEGGPSLHSIARMASYDTSSEAMTSVWLTTGTRDAAVMRSLIDLLALIPPENIISLHDDSEHSKGRLTMGSTTLSTLRHMCTFSESLAGIVASDAELATLWECLEHVDAPSCSSLRHCQNLLKRKNSLNDILSNENGDSEAQILRNLNDCLMQVMDLLDVGSGKGGDIVPACMTLLTRSVDIGSAQGCADAVAVISRVLVSRYRDVRQSMVEQITASLSPAIANALIVPDFLHTLIVSCVCESGVLSSSASLLLQRLLTHGCPNIRNLFMSAPVEWGSLLTPLKVLEWGLGNPYDPVPSVITSFAGHLEECCARISQDGSPRDAFERTQLLGLFHNEPQVRAQCGARIRNELERYYASSSTFRAVSESLLQVDPFRASDSDNGKGPSFLYLSPWESLDAVQESLPQKLPNDDGYSGAIKLAKIAFGEQTASIRLAAIRQLHSALSDAAVLADAEISWLLSVAWDCCEILGEHYSFLNKDSASMEISDARICAEAASLLRLLVARSGKVRGAAVVLQDVDTSAAGRPGRLRFSILPVVIVVMQLADDFAQKDSLLDGQVRVICAQILSLLASMDAFMAPKLASQFRCRRKSKGKAACVTVPKLLAGTFQFPVCTEDLSERITDYDEALASNNIFADMNSVLSLGELVCVSKVSSTLTNSEYLAEIMAADDIYSDVSELSSCVGAVVCKAIALSPHHEEMRSIVHSAQCMTTVLPGVSASLGIEKLDLALARLLKTAPYTQRDVTTLTNVVEYLIAFTSAHPEQKNSAVFESLITALMFPLYPLLKTSDRKPAPSQLKEYAAFENKEVLQGKLFKLLQSLIDLPSSVLQLKSRLEDHPLLSLLLDRMSTAGSSFQQTQACEMVLALMRTHEMFGVSEAIVSTSSLEGLFLTGGVNVILNVVKTAKMLRKPDSTQGFGPMQSSLKLLCSLTKVAQAYSRSQGGKQLDCDTSDMNWKWLVRLFYDRRAEVRLLAVDIFGQLQKIDRHFVAGLESNDDDKCSPGKFLRGIAFDGSECAAVRAAASRVLLNSKDMSEDSSLLGQVITGAYDQLSTRNALLGSSTLSYCLSILLSVLSNPNTQADALECFAALKIVPSIMSLISSDVAADVEKLSFRRVGVDIVSPSVTGHHEWLGRFGDVNDEDIARKHRTRHNGWNIVWQNLFNGSGRMNTHIALCLACRFLQAVQAEGIMGSAFRTYSKQTSLVRGILSSLSNDIFTKPSSQDYASNDAAAQAEGRGCSALCDLASNLIVSEGVQTLGDRDHLCSTFKAMESVLSRQVDYVCDNLQSANGKLAASLLHLLCLLLQQAPVSVGVSCDVFMNQMLRLKAVLDAGDQAHILLSARVDVVMSVLMQRSPSLCLSSDLICTTMLIVVKSAKVVVDCTNRAMEAKNAASSQVSRKLAASIANTRLGLWSNMILLQNAFASVCCDTEEVSRLAESTGFHHALGSLIDCADIWTQMEDGNNTTTPAFTSLYAFMSASSTSLKSWVPSFAQLSVTSLSLCCAFCRDNTFGKHLLLTSCDMRNKEGVGHVWACLDSLVLLAASARVSNTVRLLSLSLLSALMGITYTNSRSFVQKSKTSIKYAKDSMIRALDTALQCDQNKVRPDCVSLLLEALGSSFIAESFGRGVSSSPSHRAGDWELEQESGRVSPASLTSRLSAEKRKITENTSMPILLKWVWESYSDCPAVVAALVRFIGRLAAPAALADSGNNGKNAHSHKLCLAAATSREALAIVAKASADTNPTVAGMASLSMWSALHASEQARANVKKLSSANVICENLSKENIGDMQFGGPQVVKANAALQVLLM